MQLATILPRERRADRQIRRNGVIALSLSAVGRPNGQERLYAKSTYDIGSDIDDPYRVECRFRTGRWNKGLAIGGKRNAAFAFDGASIRIQRVTADEQEPILGQ
jgi:hypothetical protein